MAASLTDAALRASLPYLFHTLKKMKGGMMKSVIVVTGASSGFGALTARELAKAGHTVYAEMRETRLRNVAAAIERHGGTENVSLERMESRNLTSAGNRRHCYGQAQTVGSKQINAAVTFNGDGAERSREIHWPNGFHSEHELSPLLSDAPSKRLPFRVTGGRNSS
jgi:hypothetical protein